MNPIDSLSLADKMQLHAELGCELDGHQPHRTVSTPGGGTAFIICRCEQVKWVQQKTDEHDRVRAAVFG